MLHRWILILASLMSGCSSAETSYKIEASRLADDGLHIETLINVENYDSHCRIGGHGCTVSNQEVSLYYLEIPIQLKKIPLKSLKKQWQLVRPVPNQGGYTRYFMGQRVLGEVQGWKILHLCERMEDQCETLPTEGLSSLEPSSSPGHLMDQDGHYLLAQDKLIHLPSMEVKADLAARDNYRTFIVDAEKKLGDARSGSVLPFSLVGGRYLVATSRYTGPEESVFSMIYDIETDAVNPVSWQPKRDKESIAAGRVYWHEGEFYYLTNVFEYEGSQKVVDTTHLYAANSGRLIDIQEFYHVLVPPIWDAKHNRFIVLNWRSGLELTPIPFLPLASKVASHGS
jgi:hypothetical protein